MQPQQVAMIRVRDIVPDPAKYNQPRQRFGEKEMASLRETIRARGVIQAITVRPHEDGKYMIIAGERRWRAAREVFGDDYELPTVIRAVDQVEALSMALIENDEREAIALDQLTDFAPQVLTFALVEPDHAGVRGKNQTRRAARHFGRFPYAHVSLRHSAVTVFVRARGANGSVTSGQTLRRPTAAAQRSRSKPNSLTDLRELCGLRAATVGRLTRTNQRPSAVVVIFFTGGFGLARSFRCSSILRRGTPFTIQSGAGAPVR